MKVLSVVGNRPQFIKSGPLSVALRGRGIGEVVVHTGQHYDRELSDVFFEELELPPPAYSLDLQTADVERLTPAIAGAVDAERPDWVLVYGDTNSTLAGARAAGRDAGRARRGRASQRRPHDARGAQSHRSRPHLVTPLHTGRALEGRARSGGGSGPNRRGRRRHGRREHASRTAGPRALAHPGGARSRGGRLRRRHGASGGERPTRPPRADPRRPVPAGRAGHLPGAPENPSRDR